MSDNFECESWERAATVLLKMSLRIIIDIHFFQISFIDFETNLFDLLLYILALKLLFKRIITRVV